MVDIRGFIHCFATKNWLSILSEQLSYIYKSGLGSKTELVTIVILSPSTHKIGIPNHYPYPLKVRVITPLDEGIECNPFTLAENVTLLQVYYAARQQRSGRETLFWYIHGKGVTRFQDPSYPNAANWRRLCESVVIGEHRKCIQILTPGTIDACGPLLNSSHSWPHFSGNFWWARGNYVKTLDHPYLYAAEFVGKEKLPIRWAAEAWLLSGGGRTTDLLHVPEALKSPWLYGHDLSDMLAERGIDSESARLLEFAELRRKVYVLVNRMFVSFKRRLRIMVKKCD